MLIYGGFSTRFSPIPALSTNVVSRMGDQTMNAFLEVMETAGIFLLVGFFVLAKWLINVVFFWRRQGRHIVDLPKSVAKP